MLFALLGWATICAIIVVLAVVLYFIWLFERRPWVWLYPAVPVPRYAANLEEYVLPDQDNPFPWI